MRTAAFRALAAGCLALLVLGGGVWYARRIPVDVPPAPNYDNADAWLCRPGRIDPCSAPTTATIFAPGAAPRKVAYTPDANAPVDCFYVYPTVSHVRAAYAPIAATQDEADVARKQLARFGTACRLFAPLYRQVTSAGLPLLFGNRRGVTIDVPYADVRAAWTSYLAKDNHGRGVVLIGHSQGSRLLARLLAETVDGKPISAKLVVAILPGTRIDVPDGKRVGGTYKQIPLCASATAPGCIIAYSSYPAARKMVPDARFGVTPVPGMRFACVDPAALAGAASLDADLPLVPALRAKYGTDFAEAPGLLTSACRTDGAFSYLAITVQGRDARAEDVKALFAHIDGENPAFGLHPLDLNLALGTLVDLVRRETASYLRH